MKKSLLLTGLFFMVLNSGYSQSFDLGSWNILNLKYNHNDKLSVFAEGQIRSLKFYDNFHYFEYKGGITYKFKNMLTLHLVQEVIKPTGKEEFCFA
ncbi:MAG: hypothetical protein IPK25_08780 [Saprospiraceae bacterium]|nr:hypothetical protein [Saprospiraceae bacterium]